MIWAVERLLATIDRNPKLDTAHYLLGTAYEALDSLRLADLCYSQALVLNPEYLSALVDRGKIRGGSTGVADLNRAIMLDSTLAIAYYERARLYNMMGNPYAALDDARLGERHGLDAELIATTRFFAHMGSLNYKAALHEINTLLASDSLNAQYNFRKYMCYAKMGKAELAEQLYQKALLLGMDTIPHDRVENLKSIYIPFSNAELKEMRQKSRVKHF